MGPQVALLRVALGAQTMAASNADLLAGAQLWKMREGSHRQPENRRESTSESAASVVCFHFGSGFQVSVLVSVTRRILCVSMRHTAEQPSGNRLE